MEIMDMAIMLGQRIKSSEAAIAVEKAKKAYDECNELQVSFQEYEVQRRVLQAEADKEEIDNELVKRIDTRIDELYDYITKHPLYIAYEKAQEELNKNIQDVLAKVVEQVTGKSTSGECTHDCSTCGGCH